MVALCLAVFLLTRAWYRQPADPTPQVESTVLLERIRPVLKLVTVEGEFSETLTYSDSNAAWFEWTRDFPWNRKQAILLVHARASVGHDLEGAGLVFDEERRTVRFTGLGEPRLLALDHQVRYFDLRSGTFNPFTASDHTRLQGMARDHITAKLPQSGLFEAARERERELVPVVRAIVESAGWSFEDGTSHAPTTLPVEGRSR
jgi:hypothetical protein